MDIKKTKDGFTISLNNFEASMLYHMVMDDTQRDEMNKEHLETIEDIVDEFDGSDIPRVWQL